MNLRIVSIVFLVLLSSFVVDASITSNSMVYDIQSRSVIIRNELTLNLDQNTALEFSLPTNYKGLVVEGENITRVIDNNKLKLEVGKDSKFIAISYETPDFLESAAKKFFIAEFENPLFSNSVAIEARLPQGVFLDKPLSQGKSVYPDPSEVVSDGQRIIVRWGFNDVNSGFKIPIFITYNTSLNPLYIVIPLILALSLTVYLFVRKLKTKTEVKEKIVSKPELHLKEEEKQLVRIITQKGDSVEQSTLVLISGLSKAKVSQLLKELEERDIVKKVKKGKKNIIILKSKLLDLD